MSYVTSLSSTVRRANAAATLLAAMLLAPSLASAGGTTIPGYGAQAQSRAGAFAAKANDPSAIFHNPAGLSKLTGTTLMLSLNLVNFDQAFTREGTYDSCTSAKCPANGLPYSGQAYARVENQAHGSVHLGDFGVIPLLAISSDLGLGLPMVFAAGVFAPSVGAADRDYVDGYVAEQDPNRPPPPQRYDTLLQQATLLLPSLAVSYKASEQLSFGGRVSWGFASVKVQTSLWSVRNFEEWDGLDSHADIEAKDNFIPAFGLGALYKARKDIELGFNYRSATHINAKGTAIATPGTGTLIGGLSPLSPKASGPYRCGPGGTVAVSIACLKLAQPQVAAIGARWIAHSEDGRERADLELDVQWENWSATSTSQAIVDVTTPTLPDGLYPSESKHGFKDAFSFRLGGSYTFLQAGQTLNLRAGIAHDTETAPLSWTRLDQDGFPRTTFATGVGWQRGGLALDVGVGYVYEGQRVVDHGGCNPTDENLGCTSTGMETPTDQRDSPDPNQPIVPERFKTQSPFNAGVYEQSYVHLSVGLSKSF